MREERLSAPDVSLNEKQITSNQAVASRLKFISAANAKFYYFAYFKRQFIALRRFVKFDVWAAYFKI